VKYTQTFYSRIFFRWLTYRSYPSVDFCTRWLKLCSIRCLFGVI